MTFSIVIPAHNEVGSLEATVRAIVDTMARHQIAVEVVVVNDHSTDGTAELVDRLGHELPVVRRVDNPGQGGYGFAVRAGLDAYTGDAVCIVMADASDEPEDIVRYFREIERGYDCAFGSRFIAGARVVNYPRQKLILNRFANWLIRILFGFAYNDVTNAFKCFSRATVDGIRPLLSNHFNLTVELPLKAIARGYTYSVIPTQWYGRVHGFSKLKIKEMGSRYLFIVLYVLLERWLSRGDYRGKAGPPGFAHGRTVAPDPDANMSHRERRWLDLAAVCLILLAFARGVAVTYDLDWPNDPDLYRDIAQAQTILDGSPLADPHYLGEAIWYNPLVPSLVAALHVVTGVTLHVLETRSGAYLNLFGVLAFYLLARALLGRWTAVAATAFFLFCAGDSGPSYASSTYSPWLFVANFAQGLFYMSALAFYRASWSGRGHHFVILGALLGLTFLGHTAPAILIGGMMAIQLLGRAIRAAVRGAWGDVRRAAMLFAVVVGVALCLSAPFLSSILVRYHLHVVNLHPTFWIYPEMEWSNIGRFLDERLHRTIMIPLAIGLVALFAAGRARAARGLVLSWMSLALAFIAYSYVWQVLVARRIIWPSIVPGFHFLRYFNAAEFLLAALGVVALGDWLGLMMVRRPTLERMGAFVQRLVPTGAIMLLVWLNYPAYAARMDLTSYRTQAKGMYGGPDFSRMFAWMRDELRPVDVVAAPRGMGLSLVGPAGRKVVAIERFFSNPYVPWEPRNEALETILGSLKNGDCPTFRNRASTFHVTYVVTATNSVDGGVISGCGLVPAFTGRDWMVYRRYN